MDQALPPELNGLRRLVVVLLVVMILGLGTLVGLALLTYFRGAPVLPDTISLPPGETAIAVTQGASWAGVVTRSETGERIHVLDPKTGAILRTVELK